MQTRKAKMNGELNRKEGPHMLTPSFNHLSHHILKTGEKQGQGDKHGKQDDTYLQLATLRICCTEAVLADEGPPVLESGPVGVCFAQELEQFPKGLGK